VSIQLQLQSQAQGQAAPAHKHHHGGGHRGGGGVSDLMSTVEDALNSADSTADPNQVIQDAIAKMLSGDGSTAGASGSSNSGTSGTSTSSTGATSATSQAADKQALADFLKAHGVDMQQFQADFKAAMKDAKNGQVNPATALKSFPPGSAVDVTA